MVSYPSLVWRILGAILGQSVTSLVNKLEIRTNIFLTKLKNTFENDCVNMLYH